MASKPWPSPDDDDTDDDTNALCGRCQQPLVMHESATIIIDDVAGEAHICPIGRPSTLVTPETEDRSEETLTLFGVTADE